MKKALACPAMVMLWVLMTAPAAAQTLEMFVGRAETLPVRDVSRIIVGNGGLLSTTVIDGRELVVLPEKPGYTNLIVFEKGGYTAQYEIVVHPSDQYREQAEIRRLVRGIPGIEVSTVGGRVILSGDVPARSLERVNAIVGLYPNAQSLVLARSSFEEPMVSLEVKFVEVNSEEIEELGVNWSTQIQGPAGAYGRIFSGDLQSRLAGASGFEAAVPNPDGFPLVLPPREAIIDGELTEVPITSLRQYGVLGLATAINSSIEYLVTTGAAVLLAEPRLSAVSGGSAEFQAGGEIPVVVTGGLTGNSIEFKPFGIILKLMPQVGSDRQIVARMEAEVSTIDPSSSVAGGTPGFLVRKTSADVKLTDGQTLVVSGLISNEHGDAVTKVAGLGDLPVLGPLFRSRSWRARKTELLVLITPHLDQNAGPAADPAHVRRVSDRREDFARAFLNAMRR